MFAFRICAHLILSISQAGFRPIVSDGQARGPCESLILIGQGRLTDKYLVLLGGDATDDDDAGGDAQGREAIRDGSALAVFAAGADQISRALFLRLGKYEEYAQSPEAEFRGDR